MTVADCKPGELVEILDHKHGELVASGRYYKLHDCRPIYWAPANIYATPHDQPGVSFVLNLSLSCRVVEPTNY